MAQREIALYHCPGACSLVTVCALEMAGAPYRLELINLFNGEQLTPEYLAISPLGKVPYMVVDGEGMSENLALITYLATIYPDAGIFPKSASARTIAEAMGGLSFCSGTLHPIVRGMFNPQRLTTGEVKGVQEKAAELAKKSFGYAEKRLAERGWWLDEPSIVDVYLYWAFFVARRGGIDIEHYPRLAGLEEALKVLPGFTAMLHEEAASKNTLGL